MHNLLGRRKLNHLGKHLASQWEGNQEKELFPKLINTLHNRSGGMKLKECLKFSSISNKENIIDRWFINQVLFILMKWYSLI